MNSNDETNADGSLPWEIVRCYATRQNLPPELTHGVPHRVPHLTCQTDGVHHGQSLNFKLKSSTLEPEGLNLEHEPQRLDLKAYIQKHEPKRMNLKAYI